MDKLSPTAIGYIQFWGDIGGKWGLSRNAAEVVALLFITNQPLDGQAISEALNVARSTLSICVRELVSKKWVRVVRPLEERREFYELALGSVWEAYKMRLLDTVEMEYKRMIGFTEELMGEVKQSKGNKEVLNRLEEALEMNTALCDSVEYLAVLPTDEMKAKIIKAATNKKRGQRQ